MISAKIIADSIAPSEVRLTTFIITYPRFIHSEFMTHRMISRNASSSRAIPVSKQIQMVQDNPAIPLAFTKNKKGMQGGEALTGSEHSKAVQEWLIAAEHACHAAQSLAVLEVHKQYANRVLEPFAHITVVATATDWDNFFALRCHEMAQPEIHELADQMWAIYSSSTPKRLREGEWHLPFVEDHEVEMEELEQQAEPRGGPRGYIRKSVARCARVSYLNHEGTKPSFLEDFQLYTRLVGSHPIHASPAEHQARAERSSSLRSGNFRGWTQFRKTLDGENVDEFKPGTSKE